MKIFIASDIHGSSYWCRKMLDAYKSVGADKLLLLGDILYHGPRNPLPDEYAPSDVAEMLNDFADQIIAIRGNCDADVDQLVLDFPIIASYVVLFDGDRTIYATHGHINGPDSPPPICKGGILLSGHTHVPGIDTTDNVSFVNPGSVSLPKQGSNHSCMEYSSGNFKFIKLD